jgi:hypothetical protein
MKSIITSYLAFIALYNSSFSQCPEPGLLIQSAACESPANLQVQAICCPQLTVQWQGQASQTYVITAWGIDSATGEPFETVTEKFSCDGKGNCHATLSVKQNALVQWSVQGMCTEGNARLYSFKSDGPAVNTPICTSLLTNANNLRIFPNPSAGELIVAYNKPPVGSNITFTVFDIAGRKVVTVSGNSLTKTTAGYILKMQGLGTGVYILKIRNGKDEDQGKFILKGN